MTYGSVCSGIEAASVSWHPLGWGGAFVSEIEAFPAAVLAHHWPKIPNLGDLTVPDFIDRAKACGPIDLLVGGTPCQAFSVAGLRRSLDDERGNLTLRFLEVLHGLAPRWFVWENVPGVLSTKDNAFGCFLAGAVGADAPLQPFDPEQGWPCAGVATGPRYGLAWRVLDAQHFGVPQRRRRVFVVGYLGDWNRAAQVLLEPGGVSRDIEAGGEEGEGVARPLSAGSRRGRGYRNDADTSENLVAHALRADGFDASEDGTGLGTPVVPVDITNCILGDDVSGTIEHAQYKGNRGQGVMAFSSNDKGADVGETSPTLRAGGHAESHANAGVPPAVSFTQGNLARGEGPRPSEKCFATFNKDAGDQHPCIFTQNSRSEVRDLGAATGAVTSEPGAQCQNYLKSGMAVRRLTPRECERLQGFADDYTLIPYRGKPAADGPRYKALGNSMAVPVMRWIGERIMLVESPR